MSSFGGDGGSGGGSASAPTEWEECMSKKHGKPFWFNRFTGESRWTPPEGMAVAGGPAVGAKTDATATAAKAPVSSSSGSKLSASAPSFTPLKAETESAGGDKASGGAALVECPQNLQGKRDFLFRGFDPNKKSKFVIDEVASFSVTESQSADEMTNVIWAQFAASKRASLCILDGMACVGGNTISFAKKFSSVISNELDSGRYEILKHNTVEVAGCKGVEFRNDSILELVKREKFDILFLDPEWGGPSYKDGEKLRLTISDVPMEDFILEVFSSYPSVSMAALKLPVNYDNDFLERFARSNKFSYQFFTKFRKMTLTILMRT